MLKDASNNATIRKPSCLKRLGIDEIALAEGVTIQPQILDM